MNIDKKLKEFDEIFAEFFETRMSSMLFTDIKFYFKNFIKETLDQQKQQLIEEIEKLPTGMFDSSPYKKDLINKLTKQ